MLKSLAVSIYLGVVLVLTGLFGGVSITPNIPNEVNAGGEFAVSITINKGNIGDFARFKMILPNGFNATGKDSRGGSFVFEDQEVKIQWLQLPYDEQFTITFNVQVPATVHGDFELRSTFIYLEDNKRNKEDLPVHNLTVVGDETVGDLTATNMYNYQGVRLKEVDCIRQKPYLNAADEIIVNLLVVNKVLLNGFAKIQEQIPRGYKAVSVKSKNAVFTNNGRFIKFMWIQMPEEEFFTVAYKLIQTEDIPNQAFIIAGEFSFFRNQRTDVVDIQERNVDLSQFAAEELVVDNSPIEEDDKVDLLDAGDEYTGTEVVLETETYIPPDPVEQEQALADNQSNQTYTGEQGTESTNYNDRQESISATNVTFVDNGIKYRVQIAAGHTLVDNEYFRKQNVQDIIHIEIHQGWHKYTVGSFNIYKEARDYRNSIWNQTPITDAFVCAYTDGQRITVQEALMIANQKWYK